MTDILPKSISILTARYCHLLIPFNANKSSLAKKSSHSILFCFSFHFIRSFFLYGLFIFFSSFSLLSPSLPRTSCRLRPSSSFSFLLRSRFYFSVRVFFLLLLLLSPFAFFFSSSSSLACTRTESRRIVDDALYDRFFFSFSLLSSSICLTHRKERKGICRGKKITTSFNANGT